MKKTTERALHALCFGEPRSVEILLEKGVLDVRKKIRWPHDLGGDGGYWHLLAIAAYEGRIKVFDLLLKHGADHGSGPVAMSRSKCDEHSVQDPSWRRTFGGTRPGLSRVGGPRFLARDRSW